MSAWAIIMAGGRGERMGTDIPKQLIPLHGETILERTLKPFVRCTGIEGIITVAAPDFIKHIRSAVKHCATTKKITVVKGGPTRQDSVWNGLTAVPKGVEVVVIHDAVRPFITGELIKKCVHSAREYGAVTVMRPLKETIKVVSNGVVVETPDRSSLWVTQTPQAFRTDLIIKAHEQAHVEGFNGTDDCILVEHLGHSVKVIEGSDLNIKITTPADLTVAGTLIKLYDFLEE